MTARNTLLLTQVAVLISISLLSVAASADTPKPPVLLCPDGVQCTELNASGDFVKWNPGFYMQVPNGSNYEQRLALFDEIENEPNIRGLYLRYSWRTLEGPRRGQYNWEAIDGLLEKAKQTGKQLQFGVITRHYAGVHRPSPAYINDRGNPDYLPGYGDGDFPTGDCNRDKKLDCKFSVAFWREPVMDRFAEFLEAFAKRYNEHPNFEMFSSAETAFSPRSAKEVADYSERKTIEAWQRKALVWEKHAPNTIFRITTNFFINDRAMKELFDTLRTVRFSAAGSPDPGGLDPCEQSSASSAHRAYCGTIGGIDHRGRIACSHSVESPNLAMENISKRGTMLDQHTKTHDNLRCTHINWIRHWTYPTWEGEILPFLRRTRFENTKCPSQFQGRCRATKS